MSSYLKLKTITALKKTLVKYRRLGKKIVFTNGCFDILHAGHIIYLEKARSLGDVLVVGLNTDASIRRLKGRGRPITPMKGRAAVICALECVDIVVFFKELTPINLINTVRPDILVKGGDWKKKDIVGYDLVTSYGGSVKTIPYVKGFSTTGIIEKIKVL